MKISLSNISKRFQRHWIFRGINHTFSVTNSYALLGHNGSGKSTLLRIIAGIQSPSAGKMEYSNADNVISAQQIFPYISFCAPGMEIVEDLTLQEFFQFHFTFKKPIARHSIEDIINATGLQSAKDKQIADFSSGMKQRVKLAQAIFSDTPILLLDEPCTNLDEAGVAQYTQWIESHTSGRLLIIASNDYREYHFCKEHILVANFK
jgi:ABC-type multidrug transport system ATPase subunit